MATKHLAKQLGLIRRSSVLSLSSKNPARPKCKQFFDYLIIIDFESTCWKDTKHFGQEIIEFPAVLMNTTNGEVESEFHTYVQPQEHPILSEFCTELTGINQDQVEQGIPLKICLSQFCSWIQRIQTEKKIVFLSATSNQSSLEDKLCTFVTWSDWDLEVCLLYECKRKQLRKPDVLNSWIDLRATYKLFYDRKPKGLNGALQDLGIAFSGREHSGLDDSRNTARLAWRMICDGCMMKITKSLDKVCPKMNFAARAGILIPAQSNTSRNDGIDEVSNKGTVCGKNYQDLRTDNDVSKNCKENEVGESTGSCNSNHSIQPAKSDEQTDDQSTTESLLSPQTLIGGLNTSLCHRPRTSYCNSSMNMTNGIQVGNFSSTANASVLGSGLVFVSTTISSVNNVSDLDEVSSSECLSMLSDWEDVAVIQESQHEQNVDNVQTEETISSADSFDSVTLLKSPTEKNFYKIFNNQKQTKLDTSPSNTHSIVYKSPNTTIYNVGQVNKQASSSFKLPGAMANHSSRFIKTKHSFSNFKQSETMANSLSITNNKQVCSSSRLPETIATHSSVLINTKQSCSTFKPSETMANSLSMINSKPPSSNFKLPVTMSNNSSRLANISNVAQQSKCSTMLPYFPKRKFSTTQFFSPPKKQSFTVHKDISNVSLPLVSSRSHNVPSGVLNSSVNTNQSFRVVNNRKITPPLCNCGRRSKQLTVSSVGPNQGRAFYSCPVGKRVDGKKKSCGYFKWDDTLVKEKSVNSPSLSIIGDRFVSRATSLITSECSSSSQKRSLGLRPSMRM